MVFIYTCNCFCTILTEHEECLRDILELKWHVSFEGRQLSRIKDNLRITGLKVIALEKVILWKNKNKNLKLKAILCTFFSHHNCTGVHQKRRLE